MSCAPAWAPVSPCPTAAAPTAELIAWLREHGITIVATTPAAEVVYTAVDLSGPVALVLGSEAFGLGPEWLAAADLQVRIPMAGAIDSLNLSVATALLLYEVVRQQRGATGRRFYLDASGTWRIGSVLALNRG